MIHKLKQIRGRVTCTVAIKSPREEIREILPGERRVLGSKGNWCFLQASQVLLHRKGSVIWMVPTRNPQEGELLRNVLMVRTL